MKYYVCGEMSGYLNGITKAWSMLKFVVFSLERVLCSISILSLGEDSPSLGPTKTGKGCAN